jgi:ribosomal-protein-alanine N-acetyltransferase
MIADAFPRFPGLETERLVLRELETGDAEDLLRVLSDPEVTRYYDDDPFVSVDQAKEQIEAWREGYARRALIRWGLVAKDSGRLVGTCGYYGFHSLHLRASIGYELERGHWRRGLMTEALDVALCYGFGTLGLRRAQAFVMPDNLGSVALLRKLGFRNEGILREYETWGSKGFVDLCCFALLAGEYGKS